MQPLAVTASRQRTKSLGRPPNPQCVCFMCVSPLDSRPNAKVNLRAASLVVMPRLDVMAARQVERRCSAWITEDPHFTPVIRLTAQETQRRHTWDTAL